MKRNIYLFVLALMVAISSVQCSTDKVEEPEVPSSIEQFFKADRHTYNGHTLQYQECIFQSSQSGTSALVVVLHGQYANGSDNKTQLHQAAMVRVWNYLYYSNMKAIMLAPQCPVGCKWDENPDKLSRDTMAERLKALIDDYVANRPSIDRSRIYIIGYADAASPSGAGGVWRMLSVYPEMFASGVAVASDPDNSISASIIALTPVLFVKGLPDIYESSTMLDTFGDWVRDAGGIFREVIVHARSRNDIYSEAFSKDNLDWAFQHTRE